MPRFRTTRRNVIASLAFGFPAALTYTRVAGQTPSSMAEANPEELLDTLKDTPIQHRFQGDRLEPVAWENPNVAGFDEAVGAVRIVTENGTDTDFGGYVVFSDEASAADAIATVAETYGDTVIESFPQTIEDHAGLFISYDEDGYHSSTLIAVQTVLVIGNDIEGRRHRDHGTHHREDHHRRGHHGEGHHRRGRHHRGHRRGKDRQSIGHAAVLVRHLLPILDRQT